jgi:hypothetical protein
LGNRLDAQLRRYLPVVLAMGGSVGEAMDHVLKTRVLRKACNRNLPIEDLQKVRACLQREWKPIDPNGSPSRSLKLLDKEIKRS